MPKAADTNHRVQACIPISCSWVSGIFVAPSSHSSRYINPLSDDGKKISCGVGSKEYERSERPNMDLHRGIPLKHGAPQFLLWGPNRILVESSTQCQLLQGQ